MNNTKSVAAELRRSIDDSLSRLCSAVDEQHGSDELRRYFDTMSRFPSYSWRNAFLIAMQRPEASLVAGFSHWRRLGRSVRKGEQAIRIISPCPIRKYRNDGEAKSRMFFKGACVFDVSQTEGRLLPSIQIPEVLADSAELLSALMRVATKRGIQVQCCSMEAGRFGVSTGGAVRIASDHSTGQQTKTLVHELAHEFLHQSGKGRDVHGIDRRVAEVEAEAVSYVVCQHFGLDVELRASRYIALWGGDRKPLAASLGRIAHAARRLIEDVKQLDPREGDLASWPNAPATSAPSPESGIGHRPVTSLVRSVA